MSTSEDPYAPEGDPRLLPVPLSTTSVWQQSVALDPLISNSTTPLPESADIVVVGGGLCGALLAWELLQRTSGNVVLLEARELASGASGRNAGHCRPDAGRGFGMFANVHGEEQARAILNSERTVFERVDRFIHKHKIECEWQKRETYDVCLTEDFAAYSQQANDAFAQAGGHPPAPLGREGAQKAARSQSAVEAYGWEAATLNPAELTLAIHKLCKDTERYDAFTFCPVLGLTPGVNPDVLIRPDPDVESREATDPAETPGCAGWTVATARGSVRARKVVLATNGYTDSVMPMGIVPVQAQAHLLSSPTPHLDSSYSLRRSMKEFYSVAPRPDGTVVLGVSRLGWPEELLRQAVGNVDDSTWNATIAAQGLNAISDVWPNGPWKHAKPGDLHPPPAGGSIKTATERKEVEVDGLECAWTGIIGITNDLVPVVGPVPGKDNLFVAAGYNGHGMARIFVTAPALATRIASGKWREEDGMPECFRLTPERFASLTADLSPSAKPSPAA
ncbi:hypothetical protein A1Q1_03237 [Trichosporon asahii var. asahii CBS 2479]|uniref:FAD dependent oxidoreductase domain-containing protein n=1 Tax=Trichosporon asahii var. asahii (strain ATCC 90039 / CBS 2479 / JCM 2466 / KCTC 7840 / NBRC 103889/ NCYC 2677 / UAMH 7654) TaxID=1186058 RepID=J4UAQ0_TRIAS|nr:hypothetical protein A1Q1_03237 [Trichosporon asahii var. asahii CBS 2479]EJT47860.1 hypothetical protein A1Q1_03237 [Trichosporon asahii var. asahii CBS 2479]